MQNYIISNRTLSKNLRKSNLFFFILNFFFFISHLVFFVFSIPKNIKNNKKYKFLEFFWQVLISQYTIFYLNSKSILSNSLIGCKVSIFITVYNSTLNLLILVIKNNLFKTQSIPITLLYTLMSILEVTIFVIYKIWQKSEMAFYTFKLIGASTKSRMANYTKNSIEITVEIIFFLCASDFIDTCYFKEENSEKKFIKGVKKNHIENHSGNHIGNHIGNHSGNHIGNHTGNIGEIFWFACIGYIITIIALSLIKSNIKSNTKLTRRSSYIFLSLNILFYTFNLITNFFNTVFENISDESTSYSYNIFKTFIIFEKIILFIFLIYFINLFKKLKESELISNEFITPIYLQ